MVYTLLQWQKKLQPCNLNALPLIEYNTGPHKITHFLKSIIFISLILERICLQNIWMSSGFFTGNTVFPTTLSLTFENFTKKQYFHCSISCYICLRHIITITWILIIGMNLLLSTYSRSSTAYIRNNPILLGTCSKTQCYYCRNLFEVFFFKVGGNFLSYAYEGSVPPKSLLRGLSY